ncbi:hypothetical protein KC356_g94 [Hortaea werneckii]|nr:hypothetical protein KC356_g94 [Hortaea werneckii]
MLRYKHADLQIAQDDAPCVVHSDSSGEDEIVNGTPAASRIVKSKKASPNLGGAALEVPASSSLGTSQGLLPMGFKKTSLPSRGWAGIAAMMVMTR